MTVIHLRLFLRQCHFIQAHMNVYRILEGGAKCRHDRWEVRQSNHGVRDICKRDLDHKRGFWIRP